eukprot:TRINITY_DN10663_c0_g1_i6.p1 TRINITY_DN10663_c0_g1~~TRINITY_DN10663_c0_g1_i6.p1  ORF type:complete len:297 (-),score=46.57 TRINITY_DN10663_c0_g1_i6:1200-2090(-)
MEGSRHPKEGKMEPTLLFVFLDEAVVSTQSTGGRAMFIGVASKVLNSLLSDYVEGFSLDDFSMSGKLFLHNLTIKPDILERFYLPVKVRAGQIGSLVISVPWTELSDKPAIIEIEDLFFLVSSNSLTLSEQEEHELLQKRKRKRLKTAELLKRQRLGERKEFLDSSLIGQLVSKILNNLQITVKSLHLRYEDPGTSDNPFAFGITLEELHTYTTDSEWTATFLTTRQKTIHKIFKMKNLAAYWNSNTTMFHVSSAEILHHQMADMIYKEGRKPEGMRYFLAPMAGSLKVIFPPKQE